MSAEIVNGHVQYKFDLGSGPAVLTSNKRVSDGVWHQLIVERFALNTESLSLSLSLSVSVSTYK